MTFGLLMAAALTCLLPLLVDRLHSSRVGNSALGVAIGAPIGVCVNCAAPIARGLHASGAAIETTLATMISSPTMNIIVLTMLFSLFPIHLAVGRILLILIFLLILLPLVLSWMPASWIRKSGEKVLNFFYSNEKILDRETGSVWNVFGEAEEGPL